MELIAYNDSALSLLAPLVAIGLAIATKKVLPSLFAGILTGILLLTGGNPVDAVVHTWNTLAGVFWDDGGLNSWNTNILFFLLILGVMTSWISLAGGAQAFGEWARKRVKTKQGSQLVTVLLGVIIFIDDYFNSLAVGSISRPLTDRHGVSRAKLAYLIDSTAAPMCVITPISSWGAYIIALIGGILVTHNVTDVSAFSAFLQVVPMNLYAVLALVMVFFVAATGLDIGAMKKHSQRAEMGELYDMSRGTPPGAGDMKALSGGSVADLLVPIIALVAATVTAIVWVGAQALEGPFTLLGAFENTDAAKALVYGGAVGLAVTLLMLLRRKPASSDLWSSTLTGVKSMLPAIYILTLAWMLSTTIGSLETGKYLSTLANGNIDPRLLPAILFILSGAMAFATGTSWGTFGIMLPIAGDLAAGTQISLILPMMGAVLAGAVFGDHCSPISDTTILSSTGASCHHIDHVVTQLPYALLVAACALVGYLILGYSGSVLLSGVAGLVLMLVIALIIKSKNSGTNTDTIAKA
ncbi:Na+/H+ antiporter NhaC family protein [Pelagibaculum spongiae]|uniref:Na+/H+ antiporter n=1 Tax=Pelagibaculum spongiae TaxID=2080658 RepID=A0A2V1GY98_9GAMM|nr:Na+/H+ antiporter NhaC family protein [Pelagibaculum spongiae]PVZ70307.1 Na+/H+ antiporter [Pelagibaculum spongiae]